MSIRPAPSDTYNPSPISSPISSPNPSPCLGEQLEFSQTDPAFAPIALAPRLAAIQAPARYRTPGLEIRGAHAARADRAFLLAEQCFENNAGRLLMCNVLAVSALLLWVALAGVALSLSAGSATAAYLTLGAALLGIVVVAAWREAGMSIIAVDGIEGDRANWRTAMWGRRTVPVTGTVLLMYLAAVVALVPFVAPAVLVLLQLMFAPAIGAHRGCGPITAVRTSWKLVSDHPEDSRRSALNLIPNRNRRAYQDFRRIAWLTLPLIPAATYLLVDRELYRRPGAETPRSLVDLSTDA